MLDLFLDQVRSGLGGGQVITDPDVVAGQAVDWTGRWHGHSAAVVRPRSTDDVVVAVAAAREHGVALVPQGGNTGLVGGSVAHSGEVTLDLRRLDAIGAVDVAAAQVTVGAGVTLAALQAAAARDGLAFGVDLAARESATIGGMAATNAGGLHVLRHGSMRRQVLGVEAVLGTGQRVAANLAGLVKDNTGYDLPGLLCGSEGTLGVITALRVGLVPAPTDRVVALLGLASVGAAVDALPVLRTVPGLRALELVLADGLARVADHLGLPRPLGRPAPAALLVEVVGEGERALADLATALDQLAPALTATAVADDDAGSARLWRWREAHPEAAAALGVVHKADVTIPLGAMARFVAEVVPLVEDRAGPEAVTFVYGHLGDGNLHVNVVGPAPDDDSVVDAVLALTLDLGGSVSAEHGIGVAKRAWLEPQRGAAAVAAMRAIKRALDPDGILNPGVLL